MSPMDQVIEERYSPMAMDPVVKDLPEPYSLDNSSTMDHPAIQSTSRINEGAKDKTEMMKKRDPSDRDLRTDYASNIYMHESSDEYPNGFVKNERRVSMSVSKTDARAVGWAMLVYGHSKRGTRKIYNKSCL
ncbi:hypothetical protein BGZ67_001512, partial [Mortierella alpina]